jgi:tRNA-(ms[2]io[6]A)-hydroxylase
VLNLATATDPGWAARMLPDLDEILLDHAHLEKKAAGSAVTLLFRYPDRTFLQEPLARLAREELAHFQEALRVLEARRIPFGRQRPSPYFGRLREIVRRHEPARLLDLLLCSALIEARSCERLALLADAIPDSDLAGFYRGLLAAEARHHGIYVDLARRLRPASEVIQRLKEVAAHEAAVIARAPAAPRLHDAGCGL